MSNQRMDIQPQKVDIPLVISSYIKPSVSVKTWEDAFTTGTLAGQNPVEVANIIKQHRIWYTWQAKQDRLFRAKLDPKLNPNQLPKSVVSRINLLNKAISTLSNFAKTYVAPVAQDEEMQQELMIPEEKGFDFKKVAIWSILGITLVGGIYFLTKKTTISNGE